MKVKKWWCLLGVFLLATSIQASVVDSLKQAASRSKGAQKAYTYIRLEQHYRHQNIDSALYFIKLAKQIVAAEHIDSLWCPIYSNIAINFKLRGQNDSTLYYFTLSLNKAIALKDSLAISTAYNNLGVFYNDKGERPKALEFYIKAASISEKIRDKDAMALSYNNIGTVHYNTENYTKAKTFYEKALVIRLEQQDSAKIAMLYNNLGILAYFDSKPQDCLNYFKQAAKIWTKSKNHRQLAMVFSNIGELYFELGMYQTAMNYLKESRQIYQLLNDVQGELSVVTLLGQVYQEWGNLPVALSYYEQSYMAAKSIDAQQEMTDAALNMAQLYEDTKQFESANKYLKIYIQLKDSMVNADKNKSMQEMQTRFETEKKQQEIEILNQKNKLSQTQLNRQKIMTTAAVVGFGLVLLVVVLIIRQSRIRKRVNGMLQMKNWEIMQQNEEIMAQRDEIEAQRDTLNWQKEKLEGTNLHLSQSISYAQRIQNAALPNEKILLSHFAEEFVLFKPRDVVSGDFYWWAEVEEHLVLTAADCTGHGVPGAFMSMLGISMLKEIVVRGYLTHPAVILRKLRKDVIGTLGQKGEIGEQKDGMDMALISYHAKSKALQFAGANNPIYIISTSDLSVNNSLVRTFEHQNQDWKLFEIKPDKMPIAIYDKMNAFTNHEFTLNSGDMVYMFSDGFADQFGGEHGKKFKYAQLKHLLLDHAHLSMSQQKQAILKAFDLWKTHHEQVDDIVLLGFKA